MFSLCVISPIRTAVHRWSIFGTLKNSENNRINGNDENTENNEDYNDVGKIMFLGNKTFKIEHKKIRWTTLENSFLNFRKGDTDMLILTNQFLNLRNSQKEQLRPPVKYICRCPWIMPSGNETS